MVHALLELADISFPAGAARLLKHGADLVKVGVLEGLGGADDKGAVLADDVGVDYGVGGVEGQGLADVLHRKARHQGNGLPPAVHGIAGGHAHEHQLVSRRVGAHGHLLLPAAQGGQEGGRVCDLYVAAVEHLKGPVIAVEAKTGEVPGLGAEDQVAGELLVAGRARLVGLHQGLHLSQAQVDGGGEVERDLLAHAVHVELAHLADGD